MNTSKKTVTAEMIMGVMKEEELLVVPVGDDQDVCMLVTKTISIEDALELVGNIVSACVDTDEVEYTPEGYGTIVRREVLTKYANIEMPDDIDAVYKLVWQSGLYERVYELINKEQLNDLLESANMRIGFERSMMVSTAAKKTAEMLDKLNQIMDSFGSVFNDMNNESMNRLMQNLSKMENIDAAGIVKAISEQHKTKRKTVKKKAPQKADDAVDG